MIISPAFEYLAYENKSLLRRINALTKTILLFIYLFLNVWLKNYLYFFILALSIVFFLLSRIRVFYIKRALITALFIALTLFSVRVFLWKDGDTILAIISSLKIISGFLFVLSYVGTTPLNEILSSLKKLKIPDIFIETFLMIYKYIFIVNDDGFRLKNAQMVRMGYKDLKTSLKSMGGLWGALFLRSVGRAEKVVDALYVRGYRGNLFYPTSIQKMTATDLIIISFVGFFPLLIALVGVI